MEIDESDQTQAHIAYAFRLLRNADEVAELRMPGTKKGHIGGYFSNYEALLDAVEAHNGVANVLVTLNPVNPALLARANNKAISRLKPTVSDADILQRNWLLVNINPVRPAGISSTDEEHETALTIAAQISDDLIEAGWPESVFADSGNDAHLLYYIDLPNDESSTNLIKDVLAVLDQRYSSETVKIDTTAFKAAQFVRLYGTVAIAGDETEDRPHRVSQILQCPAEIQAVSHERLEELAANAYEEPENAADAEPADEETQADILLRLADEATYFKDEIDEAYAAVTVDNHTELWKLKSKPFGLWLTKRYFEETRKAPGTDAMRQARSVMEMKALFEGEQRKLHLRVAELDGAMYYDLADKDWRAVKILPHHCELLTHPPVLFFRNKNSKAQVEPDFDGDVRLLLKHVRVKGNYNQLLYLVYLISCFVPGIPHPVMVLCGEKGAAKTTAMRMSRAIVDPAMRDVLIMPNSMQDLALTIANNYMPCFDNMDGLSSDKSDLLCTASTGGSFSKRMLFTDDDETILSFLRCLGMNGINIAVTKPDLLDRSIIFELERIGEEERKEEKRVWEEFTEDKPAIVGGALTVLSKAMAIYPTLELEKLGRMADFTRWGYAIAEAVGYGGDAFLEAYWSNQHRANDEVITSHPVASAIVALMKATDAWKGSVDELLGVLEAVAEQERIDTHVSVWPKAAHILSRRLNEIKSNLKQTGIVFDKRSSGDAKIVTIKKE